jgi:Tol biopolymer transport system component
MFVSLTSRRWPFLAAMALVHGVQLCAAESAPPPQARKVEGLGSIPPEAALVCLSARAQEQSEFGPPALDIYVADAQGEHLTRITRQRKLYNHVAVAPDRRMIAAGRMDFGDTNLDGRISGNKDRKKLIVLDLQAQQEWEPVPDADDCCLGGVDWTPNGRYIVASLRFGRVRDIYRVHPDGSGRENLTQNLGQLLETPKPVWVSDVGVSFDGQWICFLCVVKRDDLCRIVRMRIDGSAAHFVTDGGGAQAMTRGSTDGSGDFDPEFSPDGGSLCFQRSNGRRVAFGGYPSSDVMCVKVDGSDLRRLSPAGNEAVHGIAKWSQDNRIVFSEWNPVDRWQGVVIVNPDGTNYHRVEKLQGYTWVRWIPPASPR